GTPTIDRTAAWVGSETTLGMGRRCSRAVGSRVPTGPLQHSEAVSHQCSFQCRRYDSVPYSTGARAGLAVCRWGSFGTQPNAVAARTSAQPPHLWRPEENPGQHPIPGDSVQSARGPRQRTKRVCSAATNRVEPKEGTNNMNVSTRPILSGVLLILLASCLPAG